MRTSTAWTIKVAVLLLIMALPALAGAQTKTLKETKKQAEARKAAEEAAKKEAEEKAAQEAAQKEAEEKAAAEEAAKKEAEEKAAQEAKAAPATEVTAQADPAPMGGPLYEDGGVFGAGLVIGAKVGGGFGQVTSSLGATFVGELELGYNLPLPDPVGRDLGLFVATSYAGPGAEETVNAGDERLPSPGSFSYTLTLQQLIITPGVIYRIPVPADWVRPYAAAGFRVYLTRTEISGKSGGQAYGDNEETATDYGGYGSLGADFFVGGPGSILCELQFGYAPVDGYILRNTNAGSLNIAVGYRLFL